MLEAYTGANILVTSPFSDCIIFMKLCVPDVAVAVFS